MTLVTVASNKKKPVQTPSNRTPPRKHPRPNRKVHYEEQITEVDSEKEEEVDDEDPDRT